MSTELFLRLIRERMRQQNLTPRMLATRLNGRVSQATIYKFINDGRAVTTDTLAEILKALDGDVRITFRKKED